MKDGEVGVEEGSCGYVDGGFTVGPAAGRESGGVEGEADVVREDGAETEGCAFVSKSRGKTGDVKAELSPGIRFGDGYGLERNVLSLMMLRK